MAELFRPTLPPKYGYVEIELDGKRMYENIETGDIVDPNQPVPPEPREPSAEEDMDAMLVDHEYRLTLIELGLTEGGGL